MAVFKHKHKDEEDRNITKRCCCPVVPSKLLGYRGSKEIKTFECDDCNATHTFYPGLKLPASQPHRFDPKECKCVNCEDRRNAKKHF